MDINKCVVTAALAVAVATSGCMSSTDLLRDLLQPIPLFRLQGLGLLYSLARRRRRCLPSASHAP